MKKLILLPLLLGTFATGTSFADTSSFTSSTQVYQSPQAFPQQGEGRGFEHFERTEGACQGHSDGSACVVQGREGEKEGHCEYRHNRFAESHNLNGSTQAETSQSSQSEELVCVLPHVGHGPKPMPNNETPASP